MKTSSLRAELPRVLIIEDDEDIKELYLGILESRGFAVETCANGEEALAFLKSHQEPCLILLDMLMPIMNGRQFMKAFSKRTHTIIPIPVYLISATASRKDGEEMGCRGFIKKPVDLGVLLSIVQNHCNVICAHSSLRTLGNGLATKSLLE